MNALGADRSGVPPTNPVRLILQRLTSFGKTVALCQRVRFLQSGKIQAWESYIDLGRLASRLMLLPRSSTIAHLPIARVEHQGHPSSRIPYLRHCVPRNRYAQIRGNRGFSCHSSVVAQRLSVAQVGGKLRRRFHPSERPKVAGPVHPLVIKVPTSREEWDPNMTLSAETYPPSECRPAFE
jgi:hypothetical protein